MENLKIEQIHHVAYRCNNCKETVDWYKKVLNMDLTVAISEDHVPSTKETNPYMHIFLDAGRGNILAFFELPNSTKMDVPICGANTPVWVQHIAFQVSNESELLMWKKKIESLGIDVIGITNHGIIKSIYFFDPNSHRLELTCWTNTPEQMAELREIAYPMVTEFSKTGIVSREAQWLHAEEFNPTGLEERLSDSEGWMSPKMLKNEIPTDSPTFKRSVVTSFPNSSVVLHLKRFRFAGRPVKIIKKMPMPFSFVRDGRIWKLTAFVLHSGHPGGGHYVSFVYHNSTWYCCNDASVRPSVIKEVQNRAEQAYMYLYNKS